MFVYDYEFVITPTGRGFNSSFTKPLSFTAFVRKAKNKKDAKTRFMKEQYPAVLKNGIVRNVKQLEAALQIRRIESHKVS